MNMDARKVDFLEQFTGITWAQRGVASLVGEDASLGLKKAWAGIESGMKIFGIHGLFPIVPRQLNLWDRHMTSVSNDPVWQEAA